MGQEIHVDTPNLEQVLGVKAEGTLMRFCVIKLLLLQKKINLPWVILYRRPSLLKAASAVAGTDGRNSMETEEIPHELNEGEDYMQRMIG
ncbi:putative X-linked retinitis pigmentosa GTPase regulator [Sesbania bispinosa]|nr:putative X-linked retinitis pigmentosa GTPase regulator [Sesbania bispinosa]